MDNKYNSSLCNGYNVQSTSEISKWLVLSEWNEKSPTSHPISNINMTDFLDPSNRDLNPKEEARFHHVKSNSGQIFTVSESDDIDSDDILLDNVSTNDEEIPLEQELLLLQEENSRPPSIPNCSESIPTVIVNPSPLYSNTNSNCGCPESTYSNDSREIPYAKINTQSSLENLSKPFRNGQENQVFNHESTEQAFDRNSYSNNINLDKHSSSFQNTVCTNSTSATHSQFVSVNNFVAEDSANTENIANCNICPTPCKSLDSNIDSSLNERNLANSYHLGNDKSTDNHLRNSSVDEQGFVSCNRLASNLKSLDCKFANNSLDKGIVEDGISRSYDESSTDKDYRQGSLSKEETNSANFSTTSKSSVSDFENSFSNQESAVNFNTYKTDSKSSLDFNISRSDKFFDCHSFREAILNKENASKMLVGSESVHEAKPHFTDNAKSLNLEASKTLRDYNHNILNSGFEKPQEPVHLKPSEATIDSLNVDLFRHQMSNKINNESEVEISHGVENRSIDDRLKMNDEILLATRNKKNLGDVLKLSCKIISLYFPWLSDRHEELTSNNILNSTPENKTQSISENKNVDYEQSNSNDRCSPLSLEPSSASNELSNDDWTTNVKTEKENDGNQNSVIKIEPSSPSNELSNNWTTNVKMEKENDGNQNSVIKIEPSSPSNELSNNWTTNVKMEKENDGKQNSVIKIEPSSPSNELSNNWTTNVKMEKENDGNQNSVIKIEPSSPSNELSNNWTTNVKMEKENDGNQNSVIKIEPSSPSNELSNDDWTTDIKIKKEYVKDDSNQNPVIQMRDQLNGNRQFSACLEDQQFPTEFNLTKNKESATTQREFDERLKSNASLSKNNCNLGHTINSNTTPKIFNENNNAFIKDKMPAKITLSKHNVLKKYENFKITVPCSPIKYNNNQPVKIEKGVQKKNKSRTAKKCAKALRHLSEMPNMCLPVPQLRKSTRISSTVCKVETGPASDKALQSTSNATSIDKSTSSTTEDSTSKRKFIKAKRNFDKEKQLSDLLKGESSMREINERVQQVCRRWDVESLSNQDINLTTSAYARQHLSAEELSGFKGCLEGQQNYTLAIVAPSRKRRRYEDDDDDDDSEEFADHSLEHATKKRRLSQDVQLIAGPVKDVHPDLKLFSDQMIEMLSESQKMAMTGLNIKMKQEINQVNQLYSRLQFQLRAKQIDEEKFYYYNQGYYGLVPFHRLQYEHNFQQNKLNSSLQEQLGNIERTFAEQKSRLCSQYETSKEKIKAALSNDVPESGCLTVALRKGPDYTNHYKTTYQTVTLTPHVALAMVKEDEIYDSFYSHKV